MDSQHALTRLVRRYGPERGALLFGEYCLLLTLGFDRFRERHTDAQLRDLAEALAPLALWPAEAPAPSALPMPGEPDDPLWSAAQSLATPPLQLQVGMDLLAACGEWAMQQDGAGSLTAWFDPARTALAETLGFMPPELALLPGPELPSTAYRLFVAGHVVEEGTAYPGQDLVLGPEDAPPPAMPYAWTPDPARPGWIAWMPVGPESEPPPELTRLHWLNAITRHLSARLPRHASKLLTTTHVHALLREAEAAGYDHELERFVSLPELRFAFQTLLSQGVPLRPMPVILEGLIRTVLGEVATRKLAMEELERLNRQLPYLSTARMVAIARQSLGLPESPPPAMAWPGPPGPAPASAPAVSAEDAEGFRALAALEAQHRPAGGFWLAVLGGSPLKASLRTGRLERWASLWPPAATADAHEAAARLQALRLIERVVLSLDRYQAIARPLAEVSRWLDAPATPLSAEARALIAAPRFESWRWMLAEPSRLVAASGQGSAFDAYRSACLQA